MAEAVTIGGVVIEEGRHIRTVRGIGYRLLQAIALVLPPSLYVLYIEHYAVNVLVGDDWAVEVPTVHFGLHGGRDFFWLLWRQYNEHRMVAPRFLFVVLGDLTSLNTKSIMLFSAAMFIATYLMLIVLVRRYCDHWLGPIGLLLLGAVWFSLSDYESALLSTQLAWYLVLFFLMACMLALSRRRLSWWVLVVAGVIAILGSYSSLQGLILWPLGLIYLYRRRSELPRTRLTMALWIVLACATTAFYFWDYNFTQAQGPSSFSTVIHDPLGSLKFFFVVVGNVVPSDAPSAYGWHVFVGVLVTLGAIAVLVVSVGEVRRDGLGALVPLPAALAAFGLIFDVLTTIGRAEIGETGALAPRYTMPTLLVLIGMTVYLFARASALRLSRGWRSAALAAATVLLSALLVAQVAISTGWGLQGGSVTRASREEAVVTLERLPELPKAEAEREVVANIYPSLAALEPLLAIARQDHDSGAR